MLLEQGDDAAMASRIEIPRGQQRARCVECRVVEAIQGAAPVALGEQDVGLMERVVGEPKTVPCNFEQRRHLQCHTLALDRLQKRCLPPHGVSEHARCEYSRRDIQVVLQIHVKRKIDGLPL